MTGKPAEAMVHRLVGLFHRSATVAAVVSVAAVIVVAAATAGIVQAIAPGGTSAASSTAGGRYRLHHVVVTLPSRPGSYVGAYVTAFPGSYAPMESLTAATGTHLNIALYYSGWGEPFKTAFATQAADHGAVTMVQIEPGKISLAAIADGAYDAYLDGYANAVASYGAQKGKAVIIGFAHEPNGSWYRWGFRHVAPATWVAAWRHVVNVFRQQGADNVTWLWTVNIIDKRGIPSPGPWWPGSSYVTWVGVDGYYYKPAWTFASLFGPTIKAVRALTLDPVLISETGAAPAAGKPAKITDLFAGINTYELLGLVWFDTKRVRDWRINDPASIAAFRQGAQTMKRGAS